MDKNKYAFIPEIIKNILGVYIIVQFGDWFGISKLSSSINQVLIIYFAVSAIASFYFCYGFMKEKTLNVMA